MNTVTARSPRKEEIPVLRGIWKEIFGSIGEESFFQHYYNPGLCVLAEFKGTPAATGYLIPFSDILYDGKALRCAMIYSVATLPEYRGKGLGTTVVRSLIDLAHETGFPAVVLCPNSDELFEYYSTRTGLRDWFFVNEQLINKEHVNTGGALAVEISINEYLCQRDELLKGTVHIRHDPNALEYQASLCKELGGGLFRIGDGCAVVECQPDGAVWIKELLTPEIKTDNNISNPEINDSVAAIARKFPACEYVIRQPSLIGKGRRFGMLALPGSFDDGFGTVYKGSYAPWYGMAFD